MLGRSWRWIRGQWPFLIVLLGLALAFLYLLVERGHWRRGTAGIAAVMIVAALLRAFLPTPRVGMLAARNRWVDSVSYLALGVLILVADIRLRS